jgi:hypothetical protein
VAAASLLLASLAGCQSTQDKARELEEQGKDAFTEEGLRVEKVNPRVEVEDTVVLADQNGAAAVVVLRNRSRDGQAKLPVAIDVRGRGGKSVFRNDAPGLEPSLVSVPVVSGGGRTVWVHDQVVAADKPRNVKVRVGMASGRPPKEIPRLSVRGVRFESLGSTGLAAVGSVRNASEVEQRDLVLHGVARKGSRIVAAGRAQVRRVKPGARARFRMFFIGDPRGAKLSISAPPTRF